MGKSPQNKIKGNFQRPILLKSLIFTAVLVVGYIGLFIIQTNQLPNFLKEAETHVSEHYVTLLENRLALTELSRLSTNSPNFSNQQQELLSKLKETNKAELKLVNKQKEPSSFFFPTTNKFSVFNSDISKPFAAILKKSKNLLEKQQSLLKKIENFDLIISNIYSYDPSTDLGNLDLQGEDKDIVERSKSAMKGLKDIDKALGNLQIEKKKKTLLRGQIKENLELLGKLAKEAQSGQLDEANTTRGKLITQFSKLKKSTFDFEISLIKSNGSIGLLIEQTEILDGYMDLLNKISDLRGQQIDLEVGSEIGTNGYRQIFIRERDSKKFITKTDFTSADPDVDGDNIVWMSQIGASWQVFLYHVATEKTIQLTHSENNVNPKMGEGVVVWQGWTGETWQIFVFDGKSIRQLSSGIVAENPDFEDDKIIYIEKKRNSSQKKVGYQISNLTTEATQQSIKNELKGKPLN